MTTVTDIRNSVDYQKRLYHNSRSLAPDYSTEPVFNTIAVLASMLNNPRLGNDGKKIVTQISDTVKDISDFTNTLLYEVKYSSELYITEQAKRVRLEEELALLRAERDQARLCNSFIKPADIIDDDFGRQQAEMRNTISTGIAAFIKHLEVEMACNRVSRVTTSYLDNKVNFTVTIGDTIYNFSMDRNK